MRINETEKIQLEKILEEVDKGATFTLSNGFNCFDLTKEMNDLITKLIRSTLESKKGGSKRCEVKSPIHFTDETLYKIYVELFKEGGIYR